MVLAPWAVWSVVGVARGTAEWAYSAVACVLPAAALTARTVSVPRGDARAGRQGAAVERLNTFLSRHLWAQVLLVVLLGWAVIILGSSGEPAIVVPARSAVTSAGAVAVLLVLTWQGGRQVRRLREVRETLRGSPGGPGAGGEAPEER
ncbi:hypothetical protein [Streptomyces sp. CB02400]|uniref:hypothetical protein n=1 Tax=Streptomyces sp. CB02400 TaxID=1703944 RepID=UPI00093E6AE5|nr:hypothetical protein [Streptomyces sp. CB02400]